MNRFTQVKLYETILLQADNVLYHLINCTINAAKVRITSSIYAFNEKRYSCQNSGIIHISVQRNTGIVKNPWYCLQVST